MKPDPSRFDQAIAVARQHGARDGGLWVALLEACGGDEEVVADGLRDLHGIETLPLARESPRDARVTVARDPEHGIAQVRVGGDTLLVCEDPWSAAALRSLARCPASTRLALARPGELGPLLQMSDADRVPDAAVDAGRSLGPGGSVIDFVDRAIRQARTEGASDIHFETDRSGVHVKFRLDGVMAAGARLDNPSKAEEVISRIKVMAQLDITERRRPQDGRIHWSAPGQPPVDLRVSIMPSIFGEDAVLRLLDKAQLHHAETRLSLGRLGFDDEVAMNLRDLAMRPHGMLLMTGPTGSGKTTTVYAALSEVNDGLEKIVTIEDPVEYELPGVLQIPVNEQKGLTFATGLRSILRHDPDKILVGEIRDPETAQIAVQSALTGHLVFTTVHANSLFDVLGRFQHFGIEAFALASALNGVVVQRLLRRVCPQCMQWRAPTDQEGTKLATLGLAPPLRVPLVRGCETCRGTGYKGRFVVAEVHVVTDGLRDMMVGGASVSALKQAVYVRDEDRLLARALSHVTAGRTSMEEVGRVVGWA